jgi:hypothetical protein
LIEQIQHARYDRSERTVKEYAALFSKAGLKLMKVHPTAGTVSVGGYKRHLSTSIEGW